MSIRLMLAGEGPNELGRLARHPSYRQDSDVGVLEALLKCLREEGWTVVSAQQWKEKGSHLRAPTGSRRPRHPDHQRVLQLILAAVESGCDGLVFARDADGDAERIGAIAAGLKEGREMVARWDRGARKLSIAGGTAIPTLEGWLLALTGKTKTESLSKTGAKKALELSGVVVKDTASMRAWVESHRVNKVAGDATSLLGWIRQAADVLGADFCVR